MLTSRNIFIKKKKNQLQIGKDVLYVGFWDFF